MRVTVESWAPEYGTVADAPDLGTVEPEIDVELAAAQWSPLAPAADPARIVRFVDGVRRIDARVWVTADDGTTRQGIAASFAAGVVGCDIAPAAGTGAREAAFETVAVRRGLFSPAGELPSIVTRHCEYRPYVVAGDSPEELSLGLQQRMAQLEAVVAAETPPADLLVVDGPLHRVALPPFAIGYIKSHQRRYLPDGVAGVVDRLAPGERTPLFVTTTSWSRYSWYLRLPLRAGPDHPWAGIVRCEASGDLPTTEARRLADLSAVTLPVYASNEYKDPRAPQNLFPVAQLERRLRHRLGDAALLYRSLRAATAPSAAPSAPTVPPQTGKMSK